MSDKSKSGPVFSCGECAHAQVVPEALGQALRCVEGPPSPVVLDAELVFVFPLVRPTHGCHRWAKREERVKTAAETPGVDVAELPLGQGGA